MIKRDGYELREIAGLGTITYTLPDNRQVAGLILPACWECHQSVSRVIVLPSGKLVRSVHCDGSFIKPATYREMTDREYRKLAIQNKREIIRRCTCNIADWLKEAAHLYPVLRLGYGGDPYRWKNDSATYWEWVFRRVTKGIKEDDIPELQIWTANTEKLNELENKARGDNKIIYISQAQAYKDLPLFCPRKVIYHWAHEDEEGMIAEEEVMPKTDLGIWEVEEYHVALPEDAYTLWKKYTPKL